MLSINMITAVVKLEAKVQKCYEYAPFPDLLRKAKNFDIELDRITKWLLLNFKYLSSELTIYKPKTILCAGCGTGEEVLALSKIFPHAQIDAVDISRDSLTIAKQNIKKAKAKKINLSRQSILEDLPKLRKKYDLVFSVGVIHHLSDPLLGFEILTSKLNSQGKLLIMLYNSYGLFFYKCQLWLLNILAGKNFKKRLSLVRKLGFSKNKDKVFIYDAYINPQVKTYTIEEIKNWAKKVHFKIVGIVPPLSFSGLTNFALEGQSYIFKRRALFFVVISFMKIIFRHQLSTKTNKNLQLPFWKTFVFQLIYLIFGGGGGCQYLLNTK